jgi:anti-anti-sigma factor
MAEAQYRLLQVSAEEDVLVLTITEPQIEGDTVAQALQRELLAAVTAADARRVIIDFQRVRYISSVAFSPLLNLRRHLQNVGGRFLVCGLSSMVGDIFYSTKMVSASGAFTAPFEMTADVPAAVAAFKPPTSEQGSAPSEAPSLEGSRHEPP